MRLGRSVRYALGIFGLATSLVAGTGTAALAQAQSFVGLEPETLQITPGGMQNSPRSLPERKSEDLPRLKWRDMLFLNSLDGAGTSLLQGDTFRLGFGADEPSREHFGENMWQFGSDRSYSFGAYGEYAIMDQWTLGATVTRSMTGGNGGVVADIGLKWNARISDGWSLEVGPSLSWATGDYVQGLFGPDSRGAGLQLHDASPGFKDVTVSGAVNYSLSESWTVGGMIGAQRFLGDPGVSALTNDEKSVFGAISFGYRF